MLLEDYFDFLGPDDIRLKGTRIGIETILRDFLLRSRTPEEIAATYPSLTIEQVYATILYYHHNQEQVHDYLTRWIEWGRRMRKEQEANPPPAIVRLRQIRAEREAARRAGEISSIEPA